MTEVGTLELWCEATDGRGRWKLAPDDEAGGFDTWRPGHGREVRVEEHMAPEIADVLAAHGHPVKLSHSSEFGHAHMIEVTPHGSLAGAADPRALTGMAAGL